MSVPERDAELAEVRALVRPEWLESCFAHMVRLHVGHSRFVRVVAVLNMSDGYWARDRVVVQLSSPTLPRPLLAKLEQACEREALAHSGKPQLVPVLRLLLAQLQTNRLLPAWDELREARELVCTPPPHADADAFAAANWLRPHEKLGRVALRAQQGAYWLNCELALPDGYPDVPPSFELLGTSFDDRLRDICIANAREIARRMHEGYSASAALAHQGPPARAGKAEAPADLSATGLQQLKHDREFLHAVAQVRGHDERKARRIVEHAERKSMEQHQAERAKQDAAVAASAATDGARQSLPSVLAIVRYVVQRTVRELPTQLCPVCAVTVLPADPHALRDALAQPAQRGASARHEPIERSHCGHWFHARCLEARLTVPPFRLACEAPGCGKDVHHPKWSERVDKLEKRWANEQAKRREIEELAGLMNMEK
ncbi:hypothetical protein KFE25_004239 [Diacronema lutheri]|uniref:RWD domain-containing protein n=1 Tax=Diacronema lutheri TaxID=2081491 RepID=A0A8J5XEX6_DIALT|nr:hypothetical protein KFE25_004239 [Diacronema lutheri]